MWTDNLKHFHFWCQKVLPLVYDDSLSYYEVLCKVTEHLNRLTTLVNEIGDELERYEGVTDTRLDNLETWRVEVDQWRANIDIWQGQINSWKDGIDSWKGDIDIWKQTVSDWITNTVNPFITDMTNRVGTIETTLTTLGNTVKFQAERSMKIIPVTMHYNTDNNQFYLQEVTSFISGGRYPFEDYLSSSSLDTDATTNGSNLIFSIRDFYVDESTVDHQFPPGVMTPATAKTVKIKKAILYGGGYVQYEGHDVYFELDIQDIQTIYDPMDFFSPLLMYTPKSNTDSRPHRIVWVPRDQYIIGTSNRIGIVEQREAALESDIIGRTIIVRGDVIYDSSNDRLTLRLEQNTNFPSNLLSNENVSLCSDIQNIIYAISINDYSIKPGEDGVLFSDFSYKLYIVNNQGSSYTYNGNDVYMEIVSNDDIHSNLNFIAIPSGFAGMIYYINGLVKEGVGGNDIYPVLKIGSNLSVSYSGGNYYLDAISGGGINYSTSEQNTGIKWIDDKDIYQLTDTYNISVSAGSSVTITSLSNIDNMIEITGFISETGKITIIPERSIRLVYYDNGTVEIGSSSSSFVGTITLTFKYTKTTP